MDKHLCAKFYEDDTKKTFDNESCIFLLGSFVFAQTSVSGTVTDNEGNLPNALVYIENRQERITSNIDGSFYSE